MADAYGHFVRTGSFPVNTLKSYQELNYNQFNVLDGQWSYENVRPEECDALDAADNYLWDKWQFGDAPGDCSGSTTTTPAGTTTISTTSSTTQESSTTTQAGDLSSSMSCDGTNCVVSFSDGGQFNCLQSDDYVECRGIPYVEAPIGDKRWRATSMITSYAGQSLDNTQYKPMCPGDSWNDNGQFSEDCLYVNIHFDKSKFDAGELMPMMYFIHGGGFSGGSNRGLMIDSESKILLLKTSRNFKCDFQGNYNHLVLEQGIMVVDIAYRLGIYGFLWSPTAESTNPQEPFQGNWGLIDQTQALTWGSIFAKHFAGDASQATLNGCSAGSESIWWHLVTPQSWPYFNQAITVGVGLNAQFNVAMATQKWNNYMTATGCSNYACLRTKTNQELSQAMNQARFEHPIKPILVSSKTSPVVDGVMLLGKVLNFCVSQFL